MKKVLLTLMLIILTIKVSGHEFEFKTTPVRIDSVVVIDGMNFYQYVAQNMEFPKVALSNQTVGIYIGRIRIDSKGNLLEVTTINPISKSIDEGFVKFINETWRKHKITIYNISDTTDFIIPVKYMVSSGHNQPALEYFVNYELKPNYLTEECKVVMFNSHGTTSQTDDMTLLDNARYFYKEKKYKKSIEYINLLIKRNPYSEDLHYMRANAYKHMNDTTKSCRDYHYLKYFLNSTKLKGLTHCE